MASSRHPSGPCDRNRLSPSRRSALALVMYTWTRPTADERSPSPPIACAHGLPSSFSRCARAWSLSARHAAAPSRCPSACRNPWLTARTSLRAPLPHPASQPAARASAAIRQAREAPAVLPVPGTLMQRAIRPTRTDSCGARATTGGLSQPSPSALPAGGGSPAARGRAGRASPPRLRQPSPPAVTPPFVAVDPDRPRHAPSSACLAHPLGRRLPVAPQRLRRPGRGLAKLRTARHDQPAGSAAVQDRHGSGTALAPAKGAHQPRRERAEGAESKQRGGSQHRAAHPQPLEFADKVIANELRLLAHQSGGFLRQPPDVLRYGPLPPLGLGCSHVLLLARSLPIQAARRP